MADRIILRVTMNGAGVHPDTVKASDLAEILVDIETAIQKTAEAKNVVAAESTPLVSLIDISEGSNVAKFSVDIDADPAARELLSRMSRGEFEDLPAVAHERLHNLSTLTHKRKWTSLEIVREGSGDFQATISADHPVPPRAKRYITGTTTLYGKCLRVGGKTPRAELQIGTGKLLFINVTKDAAVSLATRLYADVGLEGIASWDVDSWDVVAFEVTRILPYDPVPLSDAFRELADNSLGRWNNIDADAFVRDLRSE